jgi:uncharacterized membrane protein
VSQRLAWSVTALGYFGLLLLWVGWATAFAPLRHAPTSLVLAVSTLPLLPSLRGFLHGRRPAFIALGLLSLLYFIHGVSAATDPQQRVMALLETAFSLLMFAGSMARLRPARSS